MWAVSEIKNELMLARKKENTVFFKIRTDWREFR